MRIPNSVPPVREWTDHFMRCYRYDESDSQRLWVFMGFCILITYLLLFTLLLVNFLVVRHTV